MNKGGCDGEVVLGTAGLLGSVAVVEGAMGLAVVLGRFASGELGREGGAWSEIRVVVVGGGGVVDLVIPGARPIRDVGVHWLVERRVEWSLPQTRRTNGFGPFALAGLAHPGFL
jgi:hypothetical protein